MQIAFDRAIIRLAELAAFKSGRGLASGFKGILSVTKKTLFFSCLKT